MNNLNFYNEILQKFKLRDVVLSSTIFQKYLQIFSEIVRQNSLTHIW